MLFIPVWKALRRLLLIVAFGEKKKKSSLEAFYIFFFPVPVGTIKKPSPGKLCHSDHSI